MGWRPPEVYGSTIQEFFAAQRGWLRSQGVDPDEKRMTTKDLPALMEKFHQKRAEAGLPPLE